LRKYKVYPSSSFFLPWTPPQPVFSSPFHSWSTTHDTAVAVKLRCVSPSSSSYLISFTNLPTTPTTISFNPHVKFITISLSQNQRYTTSTPLTLTTVKPNKCHIWGLRFWKWYVSDLRTVKPRKCLFTAAHNVVDSKNTQMASSGASIINSKDLSDTTYGAFLLSIMNHALFSPSPLALIVSYVHPLLKPLDECVKIYSEVFAIVTIFVLSYLRMAF